MLFLFISCGDEDYPPVESTDEESKTVITLSYAGEKYNVPYEIYRAFFLQVRNAVDGGDTSVWTSADKATYVNKANELIFSRIAEIYAVFYLCKEAGINPYSKEIDEQIDEYIRISIEGGDLGGKRFVGFEGDYDAYLASLKEMYYNYSVSVLLIRSHIALDALNLYYAGNPDSNNPEDSVGALKFTKDDVRDFYYGDESVRVLRAFLPTEGFTKERAEEIRNSIATKDGESAVATYMINFTLSGGADVKNGELIGLYSLDDRYYGEITDAAFALKNGETSAPIYLNTENEVGYSIVYKAAKSDAHYESCYNDVKAVYIQNEIGRLLNNTETALIAGLSFTSSGKAIDHASISMP